MKTISSILKYFIIPCSSIVGIIYSFDMYVIGRANTVVEPTKVKVDLIYETNKDHYQRIERELTLIRTDSIIIKNALMRMNNK